MRAGARRRIIGPMRTPPVIVIVGAGFSRVVSAILLLHSDLPAGTRIVLLERPGHGIGGLAYELPPGELLLNLRADRMSAFVHAPADFANFLAVAGRDANDSPFAPRHLYGHYLAARLDDAAFNGQARGRLEPMAAEVLDVTRSVDGRWQVLADAGVTRTTIAADAVLLATGGSVPQAPRWLAPWMLEESRYAEARSLPRLPAADRATVAAIGSGLTFVDLVVALRAAGFAGRVVAVSRHGRLPRAERGPVLPLQAGDLPAEIADSAPLSMRHLMRCVVRHAARLDRQGRDYRQLLAALRPHSARLWSRLSHVERSRFLRHVRALWDVHRHRMPGVCADIIESEMARGTLEVVAGRVLTVGRSATGLTLAIQRRGRMGNRGPARRPRLQLHGGAGRRAARRPLAGAVGTGRRATRRAGARGPHRSARARAGPHGRAGRGPFLRRAPVARPAVGDDRGVGAARSPAGSRRRRPCQRCPTAGIGVTSPPRRRAGVRALIQRPPGG